MKIALHNMTVSYQKHPAVHHVSGEFKIGEATAIFGPNGAGKSTLLKAMMGGLKVDTGHIHFENIQPSEIAYLPQQSEIDRSLPISVKDLVSTGLWHRTGAFGRVDGAMNEEIIQALETVGLSSFVDRPIGALSMGQFQRVLFARILIQRAKLILLDEPFNAVDAKTTYDLLALIETWKKQGKTIIAVLHDYEQVRAYFQNTLLLAKRVVAWGKTEQVLTDTNLKQAVNQTTFWQDDAPVCEALHAEGEE